MPRLPPVTMIVWPLKSMVCRECDGEQHVQHEGTTRKSTDETHSEERWSDLVEVVVIVVVRDEEDKECSEDCPLICVLISQSGIRFSSIFWFEID